jgi:hypothetical protein
MEKTILITFLSILFIGCNKPSKNSGSPSAAQPINLSFKKNGTPFLEYGGSCNQCKKCTIDSSFLNGQKWNNGCKEMYITSVISGGKLTCFIINDNKIGPIPSLAAGQVFPLNLYVPKGISVTISNDFNSLIVSGISFE